MATFAVLSNDNTVIINIIVAETLEIAEQFTGNKCVEYDGVVSRPHIGLGYDPKTKTFEQLQIIDEVIEEI